MPEPIERRERAWRPEPGPWSWADALALLVWTLAVGLFFFDFVAFRKALFYFDITEINFPYRDFFANELKAGRFSRWCPGLYCGHPLYSESQTGYLHPLKYFLYPWLPTWQAFNLDTVLSIWLTGLGTYGWLRRHVGPAGALTAAAAFGLSGFMWAHLIHTSMNNALTSVPFLFWGLEVSWSNGRLRGLVAGAFALACQVFAGHLQDTLLTGGAVGLYGLYRAATEHERNGRLRSLAITLAMLALGIVLAGVQWVPSKELLDRSPRAGGLTWNRLTYGSWHPELIPTLVVREAYGTRARDTDWMDGFYPYHEMNAYMGLIAMALAVVGAAAYRDRWVGFWILLAALGGVLMLGRHTILLDYAHRIPILGSSRIPVRLHLWVSLAVAALAAVGVDRLARPGAVRLRAGIGLCVALVLISVPILYYLYQPLLSDPQRWSASYHQARTRWLGRELLFATIRTFSLSLLAVAFAVAALRSRRPARRQALAAVLPLLVIVDLLSAHSADVPGIDPTYWTVPPPSATLLKSDPTLTRIVGVAKQSAGEPGFASTDVDFFAVRDTLDWSLPIVWGLRSYRGETPIRPSRGIAYTEHAPPGETQLAVASVSHLVSSHPSLTLLGRGRPAGSAYVFRIPGVLPRVRLMGQPEYAPTQTDAITILDRLRERARDRLVAEDPDCPLPRNARASGTARIRREVPERLEIEVSADADAYLFVADTYDPGWSATLDGRPVPIRPAYVNFRAVFVPKGRHEVVFRYEPAGFRQGLALSAIGVVVALLALAWPRSLPALSPEHSDPGWADHWPRWVLLALLAVAVLSVLRVDGAGRLSTQARWDGSFHRFTWGAGIEAISSPLTH